MAFLKPKFKFGASGGSGNAILDEAEQQRNQELGRLYISTRAGKHFQKDVAKGVENFISIGHKQFEISNKLAEDCKKYGSESPSVKDKLSKATVQYGLAKNKMEKERDNLHRALYTLVAEPLKAMANGSPLNDARQLKQKYDRLRQDADSQALEVSKRKSKENNPEQVVKLQAAEQKLDEITSAMDTMGNNALSAMSLIESQQQNISLQKILAMVEYERAYFQRVTSILDQLHHEIEAQVNLAALPPPTPQLALAPPTPPQPALAPPTPPQPALAPPTPPQPALAPPTPPQPALAPTRKNATAPQKKFTQVVAVEDSEENRLQETNYRFEEKHHGLQEKNYSFEEEKESSPVLEIKSFYATATHDFEGEDVGELTISVGDEVLVRQVTSSGWSEGLCNGQSGWFPSTYVKRQPVRKGEGSRSGSNR